MRHSHNFIDLSGKRFGRLLVIDFVGRNEYGYSMWRCQCDCGDITLAQSYLLRNGRKKSCGCARFGVKLIEEIGSRYGKLTVVDGPIRDGYRIKWKCECQCGREVTVAGSKLRNGSAKTCGFPGCRVRKSESSVFWRNVLGAMKSGANRRGVEYRLTDDQAVEMMKKDCFYCGDSPKVSIKKLGGRYVNIPRNGIDRVDSSRGYEMTNVVPCCAECNRAKGAESAESFVTRCSRISTNLSDQFKAA